MIAPFLQTRRWTRLEYERMSHAGILSPDERVELLDGDIIPKDTTLDKNRHRKRPLYAQASIPEYWIVNLVDRCLEVYRDPVSSQGEQPARYRTSFNLSSKDTVSPSAHPEHTIAVSDLLP